MARVVKPGFRDDVARVVERVPAGCLTTYGDVAAALGAKNVARHVGWALAALPHGTDVPWHRVVNSQGRISLRADGPGGDVQRLRLEAEGIEIDESGRIAGFRSVRVPVASLARPDDDGR
jgi:methylated-DNA-protein-cysteine methyltransferase-like protein